MRRLYETYAHPLTRIVRGVPTSWDPVIVATNCSHGFIWSAVWSPCSKFIAIDCSTEIQILDSVTLKRVKSLVPCQGHTQLLAFSADSRLFTRLGEGSEEFISWDLQTGVPASIISAEQGGGTREAHSITYSECGTMFGVLFNRYGVGVIITYNVLSGSSVGFCPVKGPVADMIWTHEKCIRFATLKPGSITIWEVGFVSEHPAAEVESLPTPNNFDLSTGFLFLPTYARLAFALEDTISVWDTRRSRLLLGPLDIRQHGWMAFSSDGYFFAHENDDTEVYLWKDTPTGYTLHQKLILGAEEGFRICKPLFSPDGRSIIAFSGSILQLWHTTDTLSSSPTQDFQNTQPFVLGLSPDESLAAAARLGENIVTVLDLGSGVSLLQIDVGMKIYGLRVAGSTVVVVGEGKIVTWNLPLSNGPLNTTANINDSIRTTIFDHSPFLESPLQPSVSISPDFNYIAVVGGIAKFSIILNIYDMVTGKRLATTRPALGIPSNTDYLHLVCKRLPGNLLWFTPDGREVWFRPFSSHAEGRAIVKDSESDFLKMEDIESTRGLPEGCPWTPRRGYQITDDGWMLDSNRKRLLWLPTHWWLEVMDRMWIGRFLAILHRGFPEAVILEVPEE